MAPFESFRLNRTVQSCILFIGCRSVVCALRAAINIIYDANDFFLIIIDCNI